MGAAENRLLVSTQCPTCGAALDFGEGSNCVACAYCRSNLLVTGRSRLLSYAVTPRVEAREAFAIARFAEPTSAAPLRVGEPHLFFLPYYRFRAIELRWQRADPGPPPVELAPETTEQYRPAISIAQALADLAPNPDEVELLERHIEKNFLAVELPAAELYSLGLRPSALRLSLFAREALDALGTVVEPELTEVQATLRGERFVDEHRVAHRQLLARLLSLVYFPFWIVPIERPGHRTATIVDGVTRSVVLRDAASDLVQRLRAANGDSSTVGFRPLVCPNCGWALALRPDDFVFYCSTCFRAWQIAGEEFLELKAGFAALPSGSAGAARYLPFWAIRGRLDGEPSRQYLSAAFRCRRMKVLADLSAKLSREPLELEAPSEPPRVAEGAFFDETDAAALALFARAAHEGERFENVERASQPLTVEEAKLMWLPFLSDAYAYRDPFRGTTFPKSLVV